MGTCRVLFYPGSEPAAPRRQPPGQGDGSGSNRVRAAIAAGSERESGSAVWSVRRRGAGGRADVLRPRPGDPSRSLRAPVPPHLRKFAARRKARRTHRPLYVRDGPGGPGHRPGGAAAHRGRGHQRELALFLELSEQARRHRVLHDELLARLAGGSVGRTRTPLCPGRVRPPPPAVGQGPDAALRRGPRPAAAGRSGAGPVPPPACRRGARRGRQGQPSLDII
jgi:hypothetical protein